MFIIADAPAEGPANINEAEPNDYSGFMDFVVQDLTRMAIAGARLVRYRHNEWIALCMNFPYGWEIDAFNLNNLNENKPLTDKKNSL